MTGEIWIADDDQSILWVIEKALERSGFSTRGFGNGDDLVRSLGDSTPDLIVTDVRMPGINGFELLDQIRSTFPELPVIVMTAFGDLDSAVRSFKQGAFEYLTKPFDIDDLTALVSRGVRKHQGNEVTRDSTSDVDNQLVGDSPALQEVFRVIGRIAVSDLSVLIRGESGTGKELIANAIHRNSHRSKNPLIAINTAAIPAELLESELFGHEKGAFTGALQRHIGRFEQAHQGTLFLDEIGDMPFALQTRLLRVLSEGRFYRVGGRDEVSVDVRIIAATNQDLESMVAQKLFRNDLFHRLNVFTVSVPPLRDRLDDIPALVDHFLNSSQFRSGTGSESTEKSGNKKLPSAVLAAFSAYHWPGNIRELENVLQQMVVLGVGNSLDEADLPEALRNAPELGQDTNWRQGVADEIRQRLHIGEKAVARRLVDEMERILIDEAMNHCEGHKQKAAELLGWGRNTLARKIKSGQN